MNTTIGRLAGLAYTSSFTVESYHDGYHHTYVISMQDGVPTAINLGTFPSTEPSGVRLTVTVNPNDIEKFETTCSSIYSYFSTKPTTTTNVPLSYLKVDLSNDWFFHPTDAYDNYVLMANVLYEIPRISELSPYRCIKGTVFQIPTGTVSITPGRESLSMDTSTIKYVQELFTEFKDYNTSVKYWEKVIEVNNEQNIIQIINNKAKFLFETYGSINNKEQAYRNLEFLLQKNPEYELEFKYLLAKIGIENNLQIDKSKRYLKQVEKTFKVNKLFNKGDLEKLKKI